MQTRNLHRERFASLGPSPAPARRLSSTWRGLVASAAAGLALSTAGCTIIVDNDLAPQCSKNSDCKDFSKVGDPVICNEQQHVCTPLFTAECGKPGSMYQGQFFYKDSPSDDSNIDAKISSVDDNTIILGAILTLSGPPDGDYSSGGKPPRDAMKFALSQIDSQGILLPEPKGQRFLAILACDDYSEDGSKDDGVPIKAAKHLAEDIGVPAIIGGTGTDVTSNIAKKVTLNDGVLLFSPSATGTALSSLTTQDSRHLVWRTAPPDSYQSKAMANYIKQQLPNKIDPVTKMPVDPRTAKIYIFSQNSDYGKNFGSSVLNDLTSLTGNTTISWQNFGGDGDQMQMKETPQMFVDRVLNGASPDVVILIGYDETVDYLQAVETNAGVLKQDELSKPFYMFSDGGEAEALWKVAVLNTDLRKRIFGTAPGPLRTDPLYNTYSSELQAGSKNKAQPDIFGSAGAYDIVYLLSFAMARLLYETPQSVAQPITGATLGKELLNVSKGTTVTVGGVNLTQNLTTAQTSTTFNFKGASGDLDFGSQGEAPSLIQVWCIPASTDPMNPMSAKNSETYYDPVTNTLKGSVPASCD